MVILNKFDLARDIYSKLETLIIIKASNPAGGEDLLENMNITLEYYINKFQISKEEINKTIELYCMKELVLDQVSIKDLDSLELRKVSSSLIDIIHQLMKISKEIASESDSSVILAELMSELTRLNGELTHVAEAAKISADGLQKILYKFGVLAIVLGTAYPTS